MGKSMEFWWDCIPCLFFPDMRGHECKIEKRRGRYFSTTRFHLDETQHLSHLPSDLHNIRKICGCATTFTLQVEALHLLPQCLNGRQRPGRWQTHPSDEGLQCQKVGNWRWYVVLMGFYQKMSPIHDPVTKFDTPIPVLMNLCYVQHFRGRVFWATRWFFAAARATSHFAMNTSPHQLLEPEKGLQYILHNFVSSLMRVWFDCPFHCRFQDWAAQLANGSRLWRHRAWQKAGNARAVI